MVLLGRELMDVVDGTIPKLVDIADAETKAAWHKKDNQVVSLLCQAIN